MQHQPDPDSQPGLFMCIVIAMAALTVVAFFLAPCFGCIQEGAFKDMVAVDIDVTGEAIVNSNDVTVIAD